MKRNPLTDREVYIACVLWLHGHSQQAIGSLLRRKTNKIKGAIFRSGYSGRDDMTLPERQALFDELWELRIQEGKPVCGGLLNQLDPVVRPIKGQK